MALARLFALIALCLAAACTGPRQSPTANDVRGLEAAILAMGPGVDPVEAAQAAQLAYASAARLKAEYQIEDGPLTHNTKVNLGLKPRGLCWQWAEDMQIAMLGGGFRTLDFHRAIANSENIRLEHSTLIVSAKGAAMEEGIVLDPWRYAGELFWAPVPEDTRYFWEPQTKVLERKWARDGVEPKIRTLYYEPKT